jgi:putative SOS response-associated peptidase YedK
LLGETRFDLQFGERRKSETLWWLFGANKVTMWHMCHRFQAKLRMKDLVEEFSLPPQTSLPFPETDRYPGSDVASILLDPDGERELALLNWGLLPRWWKPSAKYHSPQAFQRITFNARSETIHEKPSFRDAFQRRRALIPVTSFYEGGHFFGLADQDVFALAGLWESWKLGDQVLRTCTVVTTAANPLVAKYHPRKRMPVILDNEEAYACWLDSDVSNREALTGLFRPFDADCMTCVPESDAVS